MSAAVQNMTVVVFADRLRERFPDGRVTVVEPRGEVTMDVDAAEWRDAAQALRD